MPRRREGTGPESRCHLLALRLSPLKQFQEKCAAVFRPELRKNKKIERFCASKKRENALTTATPPIKPTFL